MVEPIFFQISILAIVAFAIAFIIKSLKQPIIIGYIIAGIILGPLALNQISEKSYIQGFSEFGVALLLFIVGLNLNPKTIKEVGKVAFITAFIQIVATFAISYATSIMLGYSPISAVYISLALSLSSTIIVMKILTDKGENHTLHSNITSGILVMQDILAIIFLMILSSISTNSSFSDLASIMLLKGALLIVAIFALSYFILPKATEVFARSQEILLLFSISWALSMAGLFYYFNFSFEIGALIAGITLSLSPYRYDISAKIRPIRDFFILIFFIFLGSQMVFSDISSYIPQIIIFSLIIILIKPLIVLLTTSALNYTSRTGFLIGSSLGQISEFSFILIAMGYTLGDMPKDAISLITVCGLLSIATSTYFMSNSNKLYSILSPILKKLERKTLSKNDQSIFHSDDDYKIILFGYNRVGQDILQALKKIKEKFLIVDYNPQTIKTLVKSSVPCRYGDINDLELLSELNLKETKLVISTVPDKDANLLLIKNIHSVNKNAVIISVAHQINEALELYEAGASYVVLPHFIAGKHISILVESLGFSKSKFDDLKQEHIAELQKRKSLGQEHPLHEKD
jgi:Kef-type K+ transport system membrane component KefB/Trk K+ transport system NAD-binding subunit